MSCSYCSSNPSSEKGANGNAKKCCWAQAMEIMKFKRCVRKKFIVEVFFDMIISVTSVVTDVVAIILYFYKGKFPFALLTAIPVLLPTFVFTNVYLRDENEQKLRSKPVSKVVSVSGSLGGKKKLGDRQSEENGDFYGWRNDSSMKDNIEETSSNTDTTDSSIQDLDGEGNSKCQQKCNYHCSFCSVIWKNWIRFFRGCFQCCCKRDYHLRKKGADAVKNSIQKMFKYGFGTFVLRFIAWAWYIKAFIYGLKAYREPKKYLKIETPDNHWSYELLIRLDFLQAALENAPQCCIQLYALMTEPDEDVALGILTLTFSFIDFIRISVSVHWDMNKGPVTAPVGCYDTTLWKCVNTLSWISVYASRSVALAYIFAIFGLDTWLLLPLIILAVHCFLLAKVLSKAEYGIAAQKIVVATFISLFFLPELDSSVMPAIIQLYYALIIIQNAIFIMPWKGFDDQFCVSNGDWGNYGRTTTNAPPTSSTGPSRIPPRGTENTMAVTSFVFKSMQITQTMEPEVPEDKNCGVDPLLITLCVPTITIIGSVFRLVASQRMVHFKKTLSSKRMEEQDQTQEKLESSIANLFSKKWSQMSVNEMFSAFVRMLKKEVVLKSKDSVGDFKKPSFSNGNTEKKMSFLASASTTLQAEFLASQTFIRESFSLILSRNRTTRSHDFNLESLISEGNSRRKDSKGNDIHEDGNGMITQPHYNSDSELTLSLKMNNNLKKRPRLPRSRNVSENVGGESCQPPSNQNQLMENNLNNQGGFVQVDLPTGGSHLLEMCWI